ncbi:MAG: hypothetical protein HY054_12470 [Proteobacteria bacterium]|nr:hypothetical protein [Pseudomonadota bacterium]
MRVSEPPQSTFKLSLHHGIWHVTLDGLFFGAYPSKASALSSIGDSQRALATTGRVVTILIPEEELGSSKGWQSPGNARRL